MRHLVVAAAALVAAVAVSTAAGAPSAYVTCGKLSAAGRTYTVAASGISCRTAKGIVRTLAAQPIPHLPHPQYRGTYGGLQCVGGKAARMVHIQCIGGNGRKSVFATARA